MGIIFTKMDNLIIYKGDAFDILKKIPKNSIDMVFADPPYFLSNGTFTCKSGKRVSVKKGDWDLGNSIEENFKFHLEWIKLVKEVLKDNGTIWISGTYHSIYQCGFALQLLDFHILNEIVWYKPNASPNLSCRFFTASHESLIWAKKDKKVKHTFHYKEMKEWKDNYSKKFLCNHCGKKSSYEILHQQGKQMRSVWNIPATPKSEKSFGFHPTQKPKELLKRVILSSTNKGDTVLDPFMGSGTTGLVAVETDRKFIGIEKEMEYIYLAIKRINDKL